MSFLLSSSTFSIREQYCNRELTDPNPFLALFYQARPYCVAGIATRCWRDGGLSITQHAISFFVQIANLFKVDSNETALNSNSSGIFSIFSLFIN